MALERKEERRGSSLVLGHYAATGLMSTSVQSGPLVAGLQDSPAGVNNFCIVAATKNGSGSQTANNVLVRALFHMGIPVSGKNIFPSNIQGLPTWFHIRVSEAGYVSRRDTAEVVVTLNRDTAAQDVASVAPGGFVICPEEWKLPQERTDITYYTLPVQQMAKDSGASAELRPYVANMAYVGALAELLGIDIDEIEKAISEHFGGKRKPIDLNFGVVKAAVEYTRQNIVKKDPFRVEPSNRTAGLIMTNGNTAGALGAVFGGFSVAAWYPITPSTSLIDALGDYAKELRVNKETGERYYAIVQAEDELAAAGMIVGAGWMGARAMTSTSGPGLSLMTEYAGFAYFTDTPCVIWDIQRMGPSTGLPTRTSQGDILMAYYMGHGDTRHTLLLPGGMEECFEFGWRAFDLSDRLQTPIFVMSDLDLGMNQWMSKPFAYPEKPFDRGKVLSAEDLQRLGGFKRYSDEDDGSGVGPRTLPGTDHPLAAYFVRGSGHNASAEYTEKPGEWQANMERLARKHEFARTLVPKPVIDEVAGARIGIVSYGSNDSAIREARDMLAAAGTATSYLRLRALPTTTEYDAFVRAYDHIYVIENNFDGQMRHILISETPERATNLRGIAHSDGLPLTGLFIARSIATMEQEG